MRCNLTLVDAGMADGEKQFWEKSLLRINRIHVPLRGGAIYEATGGEIRLECGSAYVLPNSLARNFDLLSGAEDYYHLYIDFQASPPIMGSDIIEIPLESDGVMKNLIGAARAIMLEYPIDSTVNVKHEYRDAFEQIHRILETVTLHLHVKYGLSTVENKKIEQSIHYIEEHYAEPIGNAEIAEAIHIDSRHLIRLFTKYMNMPPYQYLTQCRIERSLSELRRGRSVAETAFLCGYQSENAFRIAFKKTMGCPPGEFIKTF